MSVTVNIFENTSLCAFRNMAQRKTKKPIGVFPPFVVTDEAGGVNKPVGFFVWIFRFDREDSTGTAEIIYRGGQPWGSSPRTCGPMQFVAGYAREVCGPVPCLGYTDNQTGNACGGSQYRPCPLVSLGG